MKKPLESGKNLTLYTGSKTNELYPLQNDNYTYFFKKMNETPNYLAQRRVKDKHFSHTESIQDNISCLYECRNREQRFLTNFLITCLPNMEAIKYSQANKL